MTDTTIDASEELPITKICFECEGKKCLTNFYKVLSGFTGRCKPCYIKNQKKYAKKAPNGTYVRKGTGFKRLPLEVRTGFLKMINDGSSTASACKAFNLNTRTVFNWKRTGQLTV